MSAVAARASATSVASPVPWAAADDRRRGGLLRKYALVLVGLVGVALLVSNLLELYFTSEETQAALARQQDRDATAAAQRIEQFVDQTLKQLTWVVQPVRAGAAEDLLERRDTYRELLRLAPAVTEIRYVDSQDREQLRVSRVALDEVGRGTPFGRLSGMHFADGVYVGEVYTRDGYEPYLTLAVPEGGAALGTTVAEINLTFVWDVVAQIAVGRTGYAYVVASPCQLVAHPDVGKVVQRADVCGLPHVQAALAEAGAQRHTMNGTDDTGRAVLATAAPIPSLPGWVVLVEQARDEALAPLDAAIRRTVAVVLGGLLLSLLASVALARRMVTPIQALRRAVAEFHLAGPQEPRVAIQTNDELEDLAEEFNALAGALRESYASQEELRTLGRVSQAVASSLDLQRVLDTVMAQAVQLADGLGGAMYEFDEDAGAFRMQATHGLAPALAEQVQEVGQSGTLLMRARERRQPVQITDLRERTGNPLRELLLAAGIRSLLVVPRLREERVVGALVLGRAEPGEFSPKTINLLQAFATQSTLAIENARFFSVLQEQRRELELANRSKDVFLANVSHELLTPLNAIQGFVQNAVDGVYGELPARVSPRLAQVIANGEQLERLVDDLLLSTRGGFALRPATYSLVEVVSTVCADFERRLTRQEVTLRRFISDDLPEAWGDPQRIRQVLGNLLSNALKFTPTGGIITLRATLADEAFRVSVADSGPGISTDDLPHVFELFYRGADAQQAARPGTGQGLYIARQLVERHGGRIWVDSPPGVGATFSFVLPVRAPIAAPEVAEVAL